MILNKDRHYTLADVEWAYQLLLGRSCGSDGSILAQWRKQAPDLRTLITQIVNSNEFEERLQSKKLCLDEVVQPILLQALKLLRPYKSIGHYKRRFGGLGKGGYVMLEDGANTRNAYSIGYASAQMSWEAALRSHGVDVTYLEVDENVTVAAVADSIRRHGEVHANAFLRCNIMGAEWELLAGPGGLKFANYRQIVIDLHHFTDRFAEPVLASKSLIAMQTLTSRHRVVHVHADNSFGYSVVAGVPLPSVLELTLVRVGDGHAFRPSDELFPTSADRPCNDARPDYQLGTFAF